MFRTGLVINNLLTQMSHLSEPSSLSLHILLNPETPVCLFGPDFSGDSVNF